MSKLSDLIGKLRKKHTDQSGGKNSVRLSKYDHHVVDMAIRDNPDLRQLIERNATDHQGFMELFEDFFGALYKNSPQLVPDSEILPEHRINREYVSEAMGSESYGKVRGSTRLNRALSLVTAQQFAQEIKRTTQEESRPNDELQKKREQMGSLLQEADQTDGDNPSEAEGQRMAQRLEQLDREIDGLEGQIERQQGKPSERTIRNIQDKVEKAGEQLSDLTDMLHNLGFSDEQLDRMTPDRMLKVLRAFVDKARLKRMAELIGRFRRIVRRMLARSSHREKFTVSGITMGDELADITDYEAVAASHSGLKPAFRNRWLAQELEIYDRDDMVTTGKGPIVIAVDVSGSMRGEKEAWSKALMMSLVEIAHKEHRDMHIIYFDQALQAEYKLKRGRVRPDEVAEILDFFTGGNTDYMAPLGRARDIIVSSELARADILFVTDGLARVTPEFVKKFARDRKHHSFRVISVCVNIRDSWGYDSGDGSTTLLHELSDYVVPISDLSDNNAEAIIKSLT
jgi:uncharacterized protein with von Willebrand factor type A (vWA) domain